MDAPDLDGCALLALLDRMLPPRRYRCLAVRMTTDLLALFDRLPGLPEHDALKINPTLPCNRLLSR